MFRTDGGSLMIGPEDALLGGVTKGCIKSEPCSHVVAATEVPDEFWLSNAGGTLQSQYENAELVPNNVGEMVWARVPSMRVTPIHGLSDDDPTMAMALRHLAEMN